MTDDTPDTAHVEVDVPVVTPEPEPTPAPVVTVVETDGGDAVDAAVLDHTIDNAVEVERLRALVAEQAVALEAAQAAASSAQMSADIALEVADAAHAEAVEANTDEQASPEDDHVPNHEHGWFRKFGKRD